MAYSSFTAVPMAAGSTAAASVIAQALAGQTRLEFLIDGDSNETQSAAGGLSLACRNLALLPVQAMNGGLWSSGWIFPDSSSTRWTAKCPVGTTRNASPLKTTGDTAYDTWKAAAGGTITGNEFKLFSSLPAGWHEKGATTGGTSNQNAAWTGPSSPIFTPHTSGNNGMFFSLHAFADNFPPELGLGVGPGAQWWPQAESDTYIDIAFVNSSLSTHAPEAVVRVTPTDTLNAFVSPSAQQTFITSRNGVASLSLNSGVVAASMLDANDKAVVTIRRFGPLTWQVGGVTKKCIQVNVNSADILIAYSAASGSFTIGETITDGTTTATGILIADSGSVFQIRPTNIAAANFGSAHTLTGGTSGKTATSGAITQMGVNVAGARFVRPSGSGLSFLPFSAQASHSAATHTSLYPNASSAYSALTSVDSSVRRAIWIEMGVNSGYVDLASADTYVADTLALVTSRRSWLGDGNAPVVVSAPVYHDNQLSTADAQDAIYDTYADAMYQAIMAGTFGPAIFLNTRRYTDCLGLNRANENMNGLLTSGATITASSSTTITASASTFNASHVGKSILIETQTVRVITSYISATQVVVSGAAITVSAKPFIFVPDMIPSALEGNIFRPWSSATTLTIGAVTGTFTIGELVTQATSLAVGKVVGVVASSAMKVIPLTGTFNSSGLLTGVSSGATTTPSAVALDNQQAVYDVVNAGPAPIPIRVRQSTGTAGHPINTNAPSSTLYYGGFRNWLAVNTSGVGDGSHFSANGMKNLRQAEMNLLMQAVATVGDAKAVRRQNFIVGGQVAAIRRR